MRTPDLSAARVLVVGDVMLDRYWFGEVGRISPEAPVPVVEVDKDGEVVTGFMVADNYFELYINGKHGDQ